MNKRLLAILITIIVVTLTGCKTQNSMIDKTVVKEFDIQRYTGVWYEIARFENKFEKGLVGVTANYSIREDGKIKVINQGYQDTLDGKLKRSVGKAKIPNPETDPAKLKVSFFWFFYADYYVLELDIDYQWAVVGSSTDNYLWILSRIPQMKKEIFDDLLVKLQNRGYETSKLILVEQKED